MATQQTARQITLGRQYSELDHLLSQVNAAVETTASLTVRGVDADVSLFEVIEHLRFVRAAVRTAIDETGRLIDEASEGGD